MSSPEIVSSPVSTELDTTSKLLNQYECGPGSGCSNRNLTPLRDTLLIHGDHYMHLADLRSYLEADDRLREAYDDSDVWGRKAILNIAGSGKFSSDRSITEYATQIWEVKPCPIK